MPGRAYYIFLYPKINNNTYPKHYCNLLALQVVIPNKEYSGQEPTKLVSRKITPTANKTYPKVPLTVFVK